jgi:hypothetical protein
MGPVEIAAGGRGTIECELKVGKPGPFGGQLHLFLEDRGLHETSINVGGVLRARVNESTLPASL